MKPLILLSLFASISFSQTSEIEMIQDYLSNDKTLAPFAIGEYETKLENTLGPTLKARVTGKSNLFRLNVTAMKNKIDHEFGKKFPKIDLSINLLSDQFVRKIEITGVDSTLGRIILRGDVKGMPNSEVQLLYYQNIITGRISLGDNEHIILLRSTPDGVTGSFEVNAKDLKYD